MLVFSFFDQEFRVVISHFWKFWNWWIERSVSKNIFLQVSDEKKAGKEDEVRARAVNSTTCVYGLLMRLYACMQISPVRLLCKIYDRDLC